MSVLEWEGCQFRMAEIDDVQTIKASYDIDCDDHENPFNRTGKYTKIQLA